jgi:hypothetical protein
VKISFGDIASNYPPLPSASGNNFQLSYNVNTDINSKTKYLFSSGCKIFASIKKNSNEVDEDMVSKILPKPLDSWKTSFTLSDL